MSAEDVAGEKKCLKDLEGCTVSVLLGSFQDIEISRKYPGINLYRLNTVAELLASVEKGKVDYGVFDEVLVFCAINDDRDIKELFSIPEMAGDVGMGFRKDETALCAQFNEFLADYMASSRYADLVDRWFGKNAKFEEMPDIALPAQGKPVRVGCINDFPFTFIKDGKWAGLEIELLMRFCEYAGRPIEITSYDFSSLITALGTGKVDIASSFIFITEERSKQILFSDPYFNCCGACFVRASGENSQKKTVWSRIKKSFTNNVIVEDRWKLILDGLWETVVISVFSILLGSLVGALLCWMRLSGRRTAIDFSKLVVDIVRGIPVLVFLMLMYYVVFASSHITARWVAVVAFAINFGAYVSEMFRTGIEGVDRGQTEAGLAMGFSKFNTFRLFVLPQALKKIIPVYKGEAISLIKNTSVVGYIAIQDLTKVSDIVRSRTFDAFFPLIIISIVYFILAWILGMVLDYLGKKI